MVRPAGIEPATLALEGRCSIQLSYGRVGTGSAYPVALIVRLRVGSSKVGRGDRIRTCDILLPKQARYRAALRPDSRITMTYASN